MDYLYKSKKNKMLCGICGGIGLYFKIDPNIIRIILISICFLTGIIPLTILYFIANFILVTDTKTDIKTYKKIYRTTKNKKFAGILSTISRAFKIDVTFLRLLFIIFAIITGVIPFFVIYISAWALLPEEEADCIEISMHNNH